MARIDGRAADQLRPVEIIPNINRFAEGSCLIRCGNTHVLCCASVEDKTPPHVPEGEGWVTAEYSMLPRANRERSRRDVSKLKLAPRSAEIQRLIGRSLRAVVDMGCITSGSGSSGGRSRSSGSSGALGRTATCGQCQSRGGNASSGQEATTRNLLHDKLSS